MANTVLNFCLDNGVHLTGSSICFTKLPYRGGGGPQRPSGAASTLSGPKQRRDPCAELSPGKHSPPN